VSTDYIAIEHSILQLINYENN